MAKIALIVLALTAALARSQSVGKVPAALSEFKIPGIESGLTCSQPPRETISVPRPVLERAKLKARLANLLHSSLLDDASGIVNIKREKEIRKLANRLQRTP